MQSQVRFNRVLDKVPEKFPGSFGAKPSQAQQGFGEGLGGFGAGPGQVQQGFQRLASRHASERFVKIKLSKTLRLLGIPPKFSFFCVCVCACVFVSCAVLKLNPQRGIYNDIYIYIYRYIYI